METTSKNPKLDSLNPWFNCSVAGVAFTFDSLQGAYYVPISIDKEIVKKYVQDLFDASEQYVNHNCKYDTHVLCNDLGIKVKSKLVCTLTLAKIINSDRLRYGLDALSLDWLKEDISKYEEAFKPYLYGKNGKKVNHDYGVVPNDIMGEYACQDVLTNRRLYKYELERRHPDCERVWNTEIELTSVLVDIERYGLRVIPKQLQLKEYEVICQMLKIETELAQITGREFRPHVNKDCYEILINQYGLPIIAWTEGDDETPEEERGNASFSKGALEQYLANPLAPIEVLTRMIRYRQLNQLKNLFLVPYQSYNINGFLHPFHNQCVRTGRLSCKEPNAQQLNKEAKSLIVPADGCAFLSCDFSQIEFRLMMHYCQNQAAIDEYNTDPETDFHDFTAKLSGVKRKAAKTVNFMVGFGGGKKKTQKNLSANPDIVADVKQHILELVAAGKIQEGQAQLYFDKFCREKAEAVYNGYHARFPEIKRTAKQAEIVARSRGYVRNLYGRHRHLPRTRCHIAFNTLNQSSAADLQKECTVLLYNYIKTNNLPIQIVATVHDETLFHGPKELLSNPEIISQIVDIMEHPKISLRVPIRVSVAYSEKSWADADSEKGKASRVEPIRTNSQPALATA